jgi:hypothetical protein
MIRKIRMIAFTITHLQLLISTAEENVIANDLGPGVDSVEHNNGSRRLFGRVERA